MVDGTLDLQVIYGSACLNTMRVYQHIQKVVVLSN